MKDLEQSVVAGVVGVVATGVAGEELIDELDQQRLQGVADVARRTGIGEAPGQIGQDAKTNVEGANDEQAGVLDEAAGGEVHLQWLRADGPGHTVRLLACGHDTSLRGCLNCWLDSA